MYINFNYQCNVSCECNGCDRKRTINIQELSSKVCAFGFILLQKRL